MLGLIFGSNSPVKKSEDTFDQEFEVTFKDE